MNIRPSNTEPVIRLNLEAESRDLMEKMLVRITAIVKKTDPEARIL